MALWYWETRDERCDLDAVLHEVFKLDRGALPELVQSPLQSIAPPPADPATTGAPATSVVHTAYLEGTSAAVNNVGNVNKKARGSTAVGRRPGQVKWHIECAMILRQQQNTKKGTQQQQQPSQVPVANRLFRIKSPAAWPREVVMVFPAPEHKLQSTGMRLHQEQRGQQLESTQSQHQRRHVVFQASEALALLPFNSEYNTRKEIVIEGQEFQIGDFFINVGVCRVLPSTYMVVQLRHAPSILRPGALAYEEIAQALGIGTRFPSSKALDTRLASYEDILPREYGPMHQALEMVELFVALRA